MIEIALKQIQWARKYEGTYSSKDPLLIVQDKLRAIRDDGDNAPTLSPMDLKHLNKITNDSLSRLRSYDYGMTIEINEELRRDAIEPLYRLKDWLKEYGNSITIKD
jgi:hypothetical protein